MVHHATVLVNCSFGASYPLPGPPVRGEAIIEFVYLLTSRLLLTASFTQALVNVSGISLCFAERICEAINVIKEANASTPSQDHNAGQYVEGD